VGGRRGGWHGVCGLVGCLTFGIIDLEFWSFTSRQKEPPPLFWVGRKMGKGLEVGS